MRGRSERRRGRRNDLFVIGAVGWYLYYLEVDDGLGFCGGRFVVLIISSIAFISFLRYIDNTKEIRPVAKNPNVELE